MPILLCSSLLMATGVASLLYEGGPLQDHRSPPYSRCFPFLLVDPGLDYLSARTTIPSVLTPQNTENPSSQVFAFSCPRRFLIGIPGIKRFVISLFSVHFQSPTREIKSAPLQLRAVVFPAGPRGNIGNIHLVADFEFESCDTCGVRSFPVTGLVIGLSNLWFYSAICPQSVVNRSGLVILA